MMPRPSAAMALGRAFLPGEAGMALPPSQKAQCDATRTLPAGGALSGLLMHPDFVPFERIYRALPQAGLLTASRSRPLQFTLGAFTVPASMSLLLAEYRFRPYRFDGLVPGDAVPFEDYRLSQEIGNDVTVQGQSRPGNIFVQIIPAEPPAISPASNPTVTGGILFPPLRVEEVALTSVAGYPVTAQIALSAPLLNPDTTQNPRQFVSSLSGAALFPQSPASAEGPSRLPFTYYVRESQSVVLTVGIFAPVRTPVAFFEGVVSGYLLPVNTMAAMMEAMRPCS